mmetsp:Transcript_2873/g.6931  ORF Transcript_2873/g.6931 Transcript_2873/m.6931 type:complete len:163 (+) Transcript_2873:52-540(+)
MSPFGSQCIGAQTLAGTICTREVAKGDSTLPLTWSPRGQSHSQRVQSRAQKRKKQLLQVVSSTKTSPLYIAKPPQSLPNSPTANGVCLELVIGAPAGVRRKVKVEEGLRFGGPCHLAAAVARWDVGLPPEDEPPRSGAAAPGFTNGRRAGLRIRSIRCPPHF